MQSKKAYQASDRVALVILGTFDPEKVDNKNLRQMVLQHAGLTQGFH
jgi:hypothetical protein